MMFTGARAGRCPYALGELPGRFRNRRPPARTVQATGRPVQSLAAFAVEDRWVLAVASMSRVTCVDMDGEELARLELADTPGDLAVTGHSVLVACGASVYLLNPLD